LLGSTIAAAANLPATTALYIPPGTSGAAHLTVLAHLRGALAGSGSADFTIVPGAVETVTLLRDIPGSDGGFVDLAVPSDLASADLSVADLSRTFDFSRPPTGDLASAYTCPVWSIFCDQFDRPNPWTTWTSNSAGGIGPNSLDVDNVNAWKGTSIHMTTSMPNNVVYLTEAATATSGEFSVRFYTYIRNAPASGLDILSLQANTTDTVNAKVTFSGPQGSAVWALSNGGSVTPSTTAVTTNAWWCVELLVNYTGNQISLYASPANSGNNPAAILSVAAAPEAVGMFNIGVLDASSPAAMDISFDDVAVGAARIGCE
jgi:hypothetical protein